MMLAGPALAENTEHWHEYGRCVFGQSEISTSISARINTHQTLSETCVKSVAQNSNNFRVRFKTGPGSAYRLHATVTPEHPMVMMSLNGRPAIQSAHGFWGISECYVTSKKKGFDILCFQGNGVAIDGVAQSASSDPNGRRAWRYLSEVAKTSASTSATPMPQ